MFRNLKNIEFSKRLLAFIEVLVLLCFCLTAAAVLMGNAEPLTALITGVFSLAATAFGFYFWKAKNENIRKYARGLTTEEMRKLKEVSKIAKAWNDYNSFDSMLQIQQIVNEGSQDEDIPGN